MSADSTTLDDLVDVTGLEEVFDGTFPPQGSMEEAPEALTLAKVGISRRDVLIRAQSWIDEHVMYDQGSKHTNKYGSYRRDCSGYVSMCWHLRASYVTGNIMQVAHRISRTELLPGDALWYHSGPHKGHIALFVGWADKAHTQPVVEEEYLPKHPCKRRTWHRPWAARFTPIRYNHIDGSTSGPVSPVMSIRSVEQQQQAVNGLGYKPALIVDNKWGPKTEAGVKWLQKKVGTPADGQWGNNTEAKYAAYVKAH